MKIAAAQIKPTKGAIQQNIQKHKQLIELAVSNEVDYIFFPELSITGYEPELAQDLAVAPDDSLFEPFQEFADQHHITIGVGMPTRYQSGVRISMLIFQPSSPRQCYSKQYLHSDEMPYFTSGDSQVYLANNQIGLAICYEISIPEHALAIHQNGAAFYVASVAKTADGMEAANIRLPEVARSYGMTTLIANCIGYCDNFESSGNSAIWNREGVLLGQLESNVEGVLILNTNTQKIKAAVL